MGKGLLVVDENKPYRNMLMRLLERSGLFTSFYEAGDFGEAKECLESARRVDMVVLDLMTPGASGLDVISWARGELRHRELPIIVLAVEDRGDIKAKCLRAGASDYMVKPFDPVELSARMGVLMKRREAQEELRRRNRELLRINEVLRQYAVFDELTRLYTKPYFIEDMTKEMKRCERYKMPMSVMLVALDDFDKLQGELGRATGDEVLRGVAEILRGAVRESDMVGRYGPEQFILKLANTGIDGASVPAERIRASIADRIFTSGGRSFKTTACIGVTDFPAHGEEGADRLLGRAGLALDEAKSAGRNRVVASRA